MIHLYGAASNRSPYLYHAYALSLAQILSWPWSTLLPPIYSTLVANLYLTTVKTSAETARSTARPKTALNTTLLRKLGNRYLRRHMSWALKEVQHGKWHPKARPRIWLDSHESMSENSDWDLLHIFPMGWKFIVLNCGCQCGFWPHLSISISRYGWIINSFSYVEL